MESDEPIAFVHDPTKIIGTGKPSSKEVVDQVAMLWKRSREWPVELRLLDNALNRFLKDPKTNQKNNWIQILRAALGISQTGLAERLGVRRFAVINFEKREETGHVTIENLKKYAAPYSAERS